VGLVTFCPLNDKVIEDSRNISLAVNVVCSFIKEYDNGMMNAEDDEKANKEWKLDFCAKTNNNYRFFQCYFCRHILKICSGALPPEIYCSIIFF